MADYVRDDSIVLHLPDEVTLEVFKQLDIRDLYEVSHACSRWKILARNNLLWTTPRIGLSQQSPTSVLIILQTMGCMEFVTSLSLHCNMTGPVDDLLKEVRLCCRKLRVLSLRGQILIDVFAIGTLILLCPMLEELILEDTRSVWVGTCVTLSQGDYRCIRRLQIVDCGWHLTMYILDLFKWIENLQNLSVEVIPHYVDKVHQLLRLHANSLRHLRLKGTITAGLLRIISCCAGLESLSLIADNSFLSNENHPTTLPFPLFPMLPLVHNLAHCLIHHTKFVSLTYLMLSGIKSLEDLVLAGIARRCLLLKRCCIVGCIRITTEGIQVILQMCPNLTQIELFEMGGVNLSDLFVFMDINNITSVNIISEERSLSGIRLT